MLLFSFPWEVFTAFASKWSSYFKTHNENREQERKKKSLAIKQRTCVLTLTFVLKPVKDNGAPSLCYTVPFFHFCFFRLKCADHPGASCLCSVLVVPCFCVAEANWWVISFMSYTWARLAVKATFFLQTVPQALPGFLTLPSTVLFLPAIVCACSSLLTCGKTPTLNWVMF